MKIHVAFTFAAGVILSACAPLGGPAAAPADYVPPKVPTLADAM